ncbi:MAG: hypothetical protein QOJ98_831 [Acidobacteriota bacterium]|jgi:hypothetical protein|nr:hypothetical protein [Acidobacteriota bacterium]
MTTKKSSVSQPAAVTLEGSQPLTPEQIVEQLRILRQHIPDFGPLTPADALARRRAATVHVELVKGAINSVGASPFLEGAIGKDADTLRAEDADEKRWSAVEDELATMHKGVAAANLSRRYRLGITALQTYAIARQLVRREEHADLLPHVEAMKRASKFGRRRRLQTPELPAGPAPVPAKP